MSAIVVITTTQGIVVGADSAVSRAGTRTGSICKILAKRDFVFAATGCNYPEHGLDVFDLAQKASESGGSIEEKVQRYISAVLPCLQSYLDFDRVNDSEHYEALRDPGASEVIFVDPLTREIIRVHFPIDFNTHTVSSNIIERVGPVRSKADSRVIPIGHASAIYPHVSDESNQTWDDDPAEYARKLLNLESQASSATVGPPFSILEIDEAGGMRWAACGHCADTISD